MPKPPRPPIRRGTRLKSPPRAVDTSGVSGISTRGETTLAARGSGVRISRWLTCASVAACVLVFAGVPSAPAAAPPAGEIRDAMRALVEAGVPGVAVRIQGGGETKVLTEGVANVRTGRPLDPSDRLRIASETKTFTAALVLELVEERRLSLEDSVERWLPGLVPGGEEISVRRLLSMTSGLDDYLAGSPDRVLDPLRDPDFFWRPRQLIGISLEKQRVAPGETWLYSNANYLLLELIVERVTGHSFRRELRERVIDPLGLRHTTYPKMRVRGLPPGHARGYQLDEDSDRRRDVSRTSPSIAGAAGALISTPGDVARFFRLLNQGRVVPPELLAEMRTPPPVTNPDLNTYYGLGLFRLHPADCGEVWGHNGEIAGFQSFAVTTPDGRTSVAIHLNGAGTAYQDSPFELSGTAFDAKQELLHRAVCAIAPAQGE